MNTSEVIYSNVSPAIGDEHLRAMGLGLCGPHRSGKTALAKALAETNNIPLVLSSASAIAKEMGIVVGPGLPFPVRLAFQERVLQVFEADYEAHPGVLFVSDRTPLDLAAYLLLDWHPHVSNDLYDALAADYVARCVEVTNRYFFQLAIVQPGIPYVVEEGKPPPNDFYQELLNTTIIGLAYDDGVSPCVEIIPRDCTELLERATMVTDAYSAAATDYSATLRTMMRVQ